MPSAPLSLNTATVKAQWTLAQAIEGCARHGIPGIAPWRDKLAEMGVKQAASAIKAHGLTVTGLCRGGFFTARDWKDDNRRAIEEAHALGAQCLVLVVGALPGALAGKPAHKDIGLARAQVFDGIAATLEYARGVGVPLAIEPLHPMQGADRACINTLEQALDICDVLDPGRTGALGVALFANLVATGLPASFLLDREGRVVGELRRPAEWDTPEAEALIRYYVDGA